MASFALEVTRFGFALLGRVAPDVAGRLAFRLFCVTPSKKPAAGRASSAFAAGKAKLAGARRVMLQLPFGAVATHVLERPGEGPRPRVLVVHGWGSRVEYLADLITGLAVVADVVALDLPGHGQSSGRYLNLRQAAEALAAAEGHFGHFDGAVGHSLGGAAVMTAAGCVFPADRYLHPGRLVLIGAPSRIAPVLGGFADTLALSSKVRARMLAAAERVAGCPIEAFDTIPIAKRLKLPLLVAHAEDDKEVSADNARRYEMLDGDVRVLWANGHGHRRIVSAPETIAAVADFLQAPIIVASPPTGAIRKLSSI